MNNLHRELAPISEAAWAGIEEEAARTLKRHLAARRVVDMVGPSGPGLSAVGTGHVLPIAPPRMTSLSFSLAKAVATFGAATGSFE